MTYNIVFENVKRKERGSEATATFVGFAPCETSSLVNDGGTISIDRASPFDETQGSKRHVICVTFWKMVHWNLGY